MNLLSKKLSIVTTCHLFNCIFLSSSFAQSNYTGLSESAFSQTSYSLYIEESTTTTTNINKIEIGINAGFIGIEDFGTSVLLGVETAFHFNDSLALYVNHARSKTDEPNYDRITNLPFSESEDREYTHSIAGIKYCFLPNYHYSLASYSITGGLFANAGIGKATFGNQDYSSLSLGVGYRLLLNRWLSWNVQFSDLIFDNNLLGDKQYTHNFNWQSGVSIHF